MYRNVYHYLNTLATAYLCGVCGDPEEERYRKEAEEIKKDIKERDERDCTRKIAPLRQAEDAVLIDSSDMTIEEVVKAITDNIV